jgi:thioredoxin-like negative regulator of GroEL
MKAILSSVCDELNIKLEFVWKENDKDNEFGRYQILSVPTIMILKDNFPLDSYIGLMSRSQVISKLSQYERLK